jgi:hypothetical protein
LRGCGVSAFGIIFSLFKCSKMNAKQENKLSMYLAVQKVCRQFEQDWRRITAVAPLVAELDRCIADTQQTMRRQEARLTGVALDKNDIRQKMGLRAHTLAEVVAAYAAAQRNTELVSRLGRSLTEYTRGRDTLLKERAEQVLETSRPILPELGEYGVTETQWTELETFVKTFAERLAAPRAAITGRRAATQTLDACFAATDELLRMRLDKVLTQLRDTPFYLNYRAARRLVNNRGTVTPRLAAKPPLPQAGN